MAGEKETRISGSEEHWTESGTDIERTVFFSDAVFAIAITLLALDLRVPQISESTAASELPDALLELWPNAFSFLVSFWIIGGYRLAHHRIFHHVRAYDRRLLLINLLFLMWIVLIPFSSSLMNLQLPVIVYAVHNILAGLTLSRLWRHALKDGHLVKTDLDPKAVRYNNLRALFLPTVFVVSIGISFISVEIARGSWLLAFLAAPYYRDICGASPRPNRRSVLEDEEPSTTDRDPHPRGLVEAMERAIYAVTTRGALGFFEHCGYRIASERSGLRFPCKT